MNCHTTITWTSTRRNNDPAWRESSTSMGLLHHSTSEPTSFGVLDNPAFAHLYSTQQTSEHCISFGSLLLRLTSRAPIDSHPLSSKTGASPQPRLPSNGSTFRTSAHVYFQEVAASDQHRSTRMSATELDIQMRDMAARESEPLLFTDGR